MSGPVPQPEDVEEVVDAVPVLASEQADAVAERRQQGALVVKQAAAVAAGSFAAGVATVAAVRVGQAVASKRRSRRRAPIVASRSFLVDVHLLGDKR